MNVLVISCHPATAEILCAGTLAKYAKRGDSVTICHVSNGNKGGEEIPPEKLGPIRNEESRISAAIIGAECIGLNVNDLEVNSDSRELQDRVVDVVRKVRPDIIITHSPDDYSPDLTAVSKLACDASLKASMFHYKTSEAPINAVVPIYFMDTFAGVEFSPDEYVDITDTINTKINMLWKHESVLKWLLKKKGVDFEDFVRTVAHFRGLQCGVPYAEGFKKHKSWMYLTSKKLLP
ncbi:MAG: PIG-L deacetylase family protein [Christensenellales bacterium]|jgi:LmbE family N-acetylglucosaminyl deacetylase